MYVFGVARLSALLAREMRSLVFKKPRAYPHKRGCIYGYDRARVTGELYATYIIVSIKSECYYITCIYVERRALVGEVTTTAMTNKFLSWVTIFGL